MHQVVELLIEALSEDAREQSRFDEYGFDSFFPEELRTEQGKNDVKDAWFEYDAIRNGDKTLQQVIAEYAVVS